MPPCPKWQSLIPNVVTPAKAYTLQFRIMSLCGRKPIKMENVSSQIKIDNRENLRSALKTTAGSRFIAATRLGARDRRLTRVTAFTSSYLILLTIFPYFYKLPPSVNDTLNLITVAFSVIVLVSSLLQYSSGDVVNSEQHHRSALEMNEQRRLLDLTNSNVSNQDLEPFVTGYNAILQKYSVNHEAIDYQKYQVERPEEFPWLRLHQRVWIGLKLFFINYFTTLVLIGITMFVVLLLSLYAYPNRLVPDSEIVKAPKVDKTNH